MSHFSKIQKIFILLFVALASLSNAQNISAKKFQYISPTPGSKLNSPETNIIIRFSNAFTTNNVNNNIYVTGSKSGLHQGKITLAEENKTLNLSTL